VPRVVACDSASSPSALALTAVLADAWLRQSSVGLPGRCCCSTALVIGLGGLCETLECRLAGYGCYEFDGARACARCELEKVRARSSMQCWAPRARNETRIT